MNNRENKNPYRRHWNNKRKRNSSKERNNGEVADGSENTNEPQSSKSDDAVAYDFEIDLNSKYCGWKLYFHDKECSKNSPTMRKVRAVEDFIEKHQDLFSLESLEAGAACNLDMNVLLKDVTFLNEWPTFEEDLRDDPKHSLNCFGLALHQTVVNAVTLNVEDPRDIVANLPMIRVKLMNYRPVASLRDLKVSSYGKFISTRGCVIRVGRSKHLPQWIVFVCANCRTQKTVRQPDGIYTLPRKCPLCGTLKHRPMLDSPHTRTVLFQVIRIQEHFSDEQDDRGRMPRTLDVELTDDLVDTCMPGDDVTVTGIVKVRGLDDGTANKGIACNGLSLYMEAVSVVSNKNRSRKKSVAGLELNVDDYFAIKEVHEDPNIFSLLVHSLCPGIYGHEMVKAGLVLSLFGGNEASAEVRDDVHVLIVGDPGLGKSQMLQACARVAPKGIYICGNSSTSSGLTVTMSKGTGSNNDFALEPGALVLADKGCCCIDEFDKMSTQHQALLEAMEQQTVSVAKAGMVCSLPARTSILAAANPIGGRFDRSKTIAQNLHMSQPLLSRFDLVFVLYDRPDEEFDSMLSEHVMAMHTGWKNRRGGGTFSASASNERMSRGYSDLRKQFTLSPNERIDVIPHSLFRKYISYARQYVNPKLSIAAAEVLKKYYLELRKTNQTLNNVPVCNRQLEALIRLTQARAKLQLRTEASAQDATEVVEIVRYSTGNSTKDTGFAHRSKPDSGKVTGNKVRAFVRLLKYEADLLKQDTFSVTQLSEIAERGGVVVNEFSQFIAKLNEEGFLLKKGNRLYRMLSPDNL